MEQEPATEPPGADHDRGSLLSETGNTSLGLREGLVAPAYALEPVFAGPNRLVRQERHATRRPVKPAAKVHHQRMGLYMTAAILTGGWFGRGGRRRMKRSWREQFGLILSCLWACTGLYFLGLLYWIDLFRKR